ncbi:hypothetical protein V1522DRAFT_425607 [Lipomyces starkeyi]
MSPFAIETVTLLALGLGIFGIRICARRSTTRGLKLEWDDYLMIHAALLYSVQTALAYTARSHWHGRANDAMSDAE